MEELVSDPTKQGDFSSKTRKCVHGVYVPFGEGKTSSVCSVCRCAVMQATDKHKSSRRGKEIYQLNVRNKSGKGARRNGNKETEGDAQGAFEESQSDFPGDAESLESEGQIAEERQIGAGETVFECGQQTRSWGESEGEFEQ